MPLTSKLEWRVDAAEVRRFRAFVDEKYGVVGLYFRFEVTEAMRTFVDEDRLVTVEEELTALYEDVADSLGHSSGRRRSSRKSSEPLVQDDDGGETEKIRCEVPTQLKKKFKKFVEENSDWGLGEALGRAMAAHRDGGRTNRLLDLIKNLKEWLPGFDGSASEDESEEADTPYSIDEKLECIRSDIADVHGKEAAEEVQEFPQSVLEESIHRWCPKGDRDEVCDRTLQTWIDRVCEDLTLVSHPNNDNLLIKAEETDGPAIDYKPYNDLSPDERVEGVQVSLIRKAASQSNRTAQMTATDIEEEVFDGKAGVGVGHDLRQRAGDKDGFRTGTSQRGNKVIKVNLSAVTDDDLLSHAGVETDEDEVTMDDVRNEMDDILNYEPEKVMATDGGEDQ